MVLFEETFLYNLSASISYFWNHFSQLNGPLIAKPYLELSKQLVRKLVSPVITCVPIEIRTNIDLHRLIQIQALFNFWVWVQHIFRSEVFSAEAIASLIMNQRYLHNFHFYHETPVTWKIFNNLKTNFRFQNVIEFLN